MHNWVHLFVTHYADMITITQNYLHEDMEGNSHGRNDDAQQFYLGRH